MFGASVSEAVESASDDVAGVSVVAAALALLAVGYAGGSVLAGEPVESQAWLVPAVGSCAVVMLALHAHESEA